MDGFADRERREDRLDPPFGILVGRDREYVRSDRVLGSLLIGLVISVGESTGDCDISIGTPSWIVCGGDTIALMLRLLMLFSSPPSSLGDLGDAVPFSLLGERVDPDVRDDIGGICGPVTTPAIVRIAIGIADCSTDWLS